jgi:hypothetical protein
MFRLLFTVRYRTETDQWLTERILSRPFQVLSNRKKNAKERPMLIDLKPIDGPADEETEVWIKGRGFRAQVSVLFGEKNGRIVETSENLITVYPLSFVLLAHAMHGLQKKLRSTYNLRTIHDNSLKIFSKASRCHSTNKSPSFCGKCRRSRSCGC